ncbi:hypothetical protein W97_02124 [Coniosporium apollinis CBS 100218]|uniref:U3 small nucleolar ribonucleoprotein protein MPP10 n=1 Tax=Coniosporium apollinis (strain CBS 100218) TaxID=1168221 RepID=R7YM50_CONA1|nr:uncharacterized protein W97_02124 [Coniosporium apollinis CBS 100218]EON62899.1 hypothetical protein W97_02124 [Coniosporium apollinis CBS 100218]
MSLADPATSALLTTLSTTPHAFLQPPSTLHISALALAKRFLDPLAAGVSDAQTQRQREARKRKRGADGDEVPLRLRKVHLEGFGFEQVWEQARRVLDASRGEVERALPEIEDGLVNGELEGPLMNGHAGDDGYEDVKMVRFDEDGFEVSGSEEEDNDDDVSLGEEGVDWEYDGEDVSGDEHVDGLEDENGEPAADGENFADDADELAEDEPFDEEPAEEYKPDTFGLNDGFFSIDDFNRQSEFLEQQDARGDPDDGAASDEEDIDWDADPLSAGPGGSRAPTKDKDVDVEDEDEEDGPTFGNVDLNAPEGASDDDMDDDELEAGEMDDMGGLTNTNNIMYADFFAPPARKASKNKKKRGRPNPHNFPDAANGVAATNAEEAEDDMERTMSRVQRDLFEDEDPAESEDELENLDPSDPRSRRSNHERRQAALATEIRRLEAANVAKREWVLAGEARAADRPVNSLLEQDLEFERAGKPVPVITQEVSNDIEALIKRRILAREFDEVRKRRPDEVLAASTRRGRFELDDTKASKGLAEEYEEEHLKRTDPNYVDIKDEKLRKEHKEIEALWKDVCAKLDSLSSWHYRPKPAAASLEIRTDAPTISMEDARPSAGGDIGAASQLAPQEVYRPGEEKEKGNAEVVTKAGLPVAREEMSREQKLRRRRREKERIRKAGENDGEKVENKKAAEQKNVVGDLKRGGVRVIGKKGELRDIDGKAVEGQRVRAGGGSFKL